jgi:nitrogen fixation protein FixH
MSAAAKPFRVTGRHVFAGVTLFFLIIIGTDAWFMTLAYRSFPGQSADNPYEAGLAFNETLAKREAESKLGWRVEATALAEGIALRPVDRAGRPLSGLVVKAKLVRPATENGARLIPLKEVSPGLYQAHGLNLSGAWDLTATFTGPAGEEFEAERRLQWP